MQLHSRCTCMHTSVIHFQFKVRTLKTKHESRIWVKLLFLSLFIAFTITTKYNTIPHFHSTAEHFLKINMNRSISKSTTADHVLSAHDHLLSVHYNVYMHGNVHGCTLPFSDVFNCTRCVLGETNHLDESGLYNINQKLASWASSNKL